MILIYGASYGLLVACKLMLAGYDVVCVCKKDEADLINNEGFSVELDGYLNKKIILKSGKLIGKIKAIQPEKIELQNIKLVFLAMQEAQYSESAILDSLGLIAKNKIPTISIMNIPPSIYLKNFKLDKKEYQELTVAYKNFDLWNKFDLNFITHGSADPQIFKPFNNINNYISVRLASNFRIAKFIDENSTEFLKKISNQIKISRHDIDNKKTRVPVNLNLYDSPFIPISKWPMLITGNYRCLNKNHLMSIQEIVNQNIGVSEEIYNEVLALCRSLGATDKDLIKFQSYLKVANKLTSPSSVARLAFAKNKNFERLDILIKSLCNIKKIKIKNIDQIIQNFKID